MKTLLATAALAAFALPAAATTTTYSNSTPIAVVDGGETSSDIVVSGAAGNITGMTLSLNGLSHTYPDDLVFGVLNQDLGIGFVFMSGVGGSADISNVNLTFSDSASGYLPESFVDSFPVTSGTYLPSNFQDYEFTFYTNVTAFAGFNGITSNGTWTLFVDDVFPADGGSLSGGWSLTFTTDDATAPVPEPTSWLMMTAGFALLGGAMRSRRRIVPAAA